MSRLKPDLIFLSLSLIGVMTASFLTYQHYFGSEICELSETISCETVNKSEYSVIFGTPVAVLGVVYFLFVGVASFLIKKNAKILLLLFYMSLPIILYSVYLTAVELIVLNAICIFCEFTKILITLIVIISFVGLRRSKVL